ncbi:hypothetical protein ACP4OV_027498 [Aristida adscensionis]
MYLHRRRRSWRRRRVPCSCKHTAFRIDDLPREFTYAELQDVTGDFETKVGHGGSAEVFRGSLDDGTAVAVKRITSGGKPVAGEEDFLREIFVVALVHHGSLVSGGGRYLLPGLPVLRERVAGLVAVPRRGEAMPPGSCRGRARRGAASPPMSPGRSRTTTTSAGGRSCTSTSSRPTSSSTAASSDFGISVSITRDLTTVDTCGRGTPGYMAPEMWANAVSTKSDVYSYGVTLLELVGGRRSLEPAGSPASKAPELLQSVAWERRWREAS